ncbi:MAG: hybrid sensor histidine kinase/response regulator, partial [Bacteroidota bacterium]
MAIYVIIERIKLKSRTEKEREISEMKTQFFMNISHEFKTPLTLIQGPADGLLDLVTDKKSREYVQFIRQNTQRLSRLVSQLLDISKLETNSYRLVTEQSDLVAFIRNIYSSFQHLAIRHDIDYQWVTNREISPQAWFDQDVVDKVLYNLISNAFKFTPDWSSITISVEILEGQLPTAIIRVRDTGSGITLSEQKRIFERFYRTNDQKSRSQGTGIGLALAQELAALHKGSITLRSELGKGSEFIFSIPIGEDSYRPEERKTTRPEIKIASLLPIIDESSPLATNSSFQDLQSLSLSDKLAEPPISVLIVDDNIGLRQYLRSILTHRFVVLEAQDGEVALKKAIALLPDVIVSDIMMPKMDGMEFCQQIKADHRTDHIPVILLTARSDDHQQIAGLEIGADDYLTKPFKPEILTAKIQTILFNRQKMWAKLSDQELLKPTSVASPEKEFIQRILTIVQQHLTDSTLDAHLLSRELGMSKS